MARPRIAVTTSQRSGWRIFPLVQLNLWLVGGTGQRWGVGRPAPLDEVDGLLIGGGDDISPELYDCKIGISARLDPDRDAFERDQARKALQAGMPVLGICRGAQMLNVALGGSLEQDVWQRFKDTKKITTILPRRDIEVCPDTHLAAITGTEPMTVNALHTQAVDRLGEGLRIAAQDRSGMVQAIEKISDPFAIGVQWHPEHLFYARRQRALFRALVEAAHAYRKHRRQLNEVHADIADG